MCSGNDKDMYTEEQEENNKLSLQCARLLGLKVYTVMYPIAEGVPDGEHVVDTIDQYPRYLMVSFPGLREQPWRPYESVEDAHRVRDAVTSNKATAQHYIRNLINLLKISTIEDWNNATDYMLWRGNTATAKEISTAALRVAQPQFGMAPGVMFK